MWRSLILFLLFLILWTININIIQGLSTQKPDLLKFVLDIKPGIREPSNKTQKNENLIPTKSSFHSNAQILISNNKGFNNNKNASINSTGVITLKDKYISKWKHSKSGILENSGSNTGSVATNLTKTNLLKNTVKPNGINSTSNLGTESGASKKATVGENSIISTHPPSSFLNNPSTITQTKPEYYGNEGLIESVPVSRESPLQTSSLPYLIKSENAGETNNLILKNKNELITSTTTLNNNIISYSVSSPPILPPNSYNLENSKLPSTNSSINYNPPQYASPPAISPYAVKTEQPQSISIPSGDAYELSVLEATLGGFSSTNIVTTTTIPTTIKTTTRVPPCGPDVLFVLDSTGSVRYVYEQQRNYIFDVAKQMDIAPDGQHVGLIIYSSKLRQRIVVNLDESQTKDQFLKIVQELPYHGGITATGQALSLTIKALEKKRLNKRTLVILLTDGYTYDEWEEQSKALLTKGVEVIVAGDVKSYLKSVLDKIAGDPTKVLLGAENKSKVLDYLRCR